MNTSGPGSEAESSEGRSGATRLWLLAVLVLALLPSLAFLSAWALVIVTNSLDPAFALGVSDNFISGMIIASSGVLTGLFAGGLAKIRGWKLVLPPAASVIIGLTIFAAYVALGMGERFDNHFGLLATVWIGQGAGIVLATRVARLTLAGAVGVLVVVGIGAAAAIQAVPERQAEVLVVLEDYARDDPPGGECWGTGRLSEVVKGSRVLLLKLSETIGHGPEEVGSVILPAGTEGAGGCEFELGNPLGRTAVGYRNIDVQLAADPHVAGVGMSVDGHRVVITMGAGE